MELTKVTRRLNSFLARAVVFCDIGTSGNYVPGILCGYGKKATPLFFLLTTGGSILLSLKYIETLWRYPEGVGVLAVRNIIGCRETAIGLFAIDFVSLGAPVTLSFLIYFPMSEIWRLIFLTRFGLTSNQDNLIPILSDLLSKPQDPFLAPMMAQRFS